MTGGDRARFCGRCNLHVYNVEKMTRAELDQLVLDHEGRKPCVRLFLRKDGTALTRDCPRGALRRMLSRVAALVGATLLVAWWFGRNRPPPFIGTLF